MVKNELTQTRLKELLEYNPLTGEWKWHKPVGGCKKSWFAGSLGGTGDLYIRVDGKLYKAHRLVFLYMMGYFPSEVVDHINGSRCDNTWKNLRECSQSENMRNSRKCLTNTSGHKCVSWRKDRNKWAVRVRVLGQYKSFGCYSDFELACLVADEVRDKYHGEFANHG